VGGRQARGLERRERILRATLAVIAHAGVPAVTHRTVADDAGVSLGSVTYYFATKDDLLREALLLFVEEEVARLSALAAQLDAEALPLTDVADRFAALLEAQDSVAQFELYLEAARNPALREAAGACFAAYEEVAEAALRSAGVPDPERHAPLVLALVDGAGLRRGAVPGSGPDLREALLAVAAVATAA
jgi:DNA-binding transcriptional regulator YbjK